MMKILVTGDTHHENTNYFKVLKMHKPLDLMIYTGDAQGDEDVIKDSAGCPVKMVAGNNDVSTHLMREMEFKIGRYNIWLTHGNRYGVYAGNSRLREEAKRRGADIVIYGHTHCPIIDRTDEDVIAVNPGSLTYPRQEGYRPSYVLMELDDEGEMHFTICYL